MNGGGAREGPAGPTTETSTDAARAVNADPCPDGERRAAFMSNVTTRSSLTWLPDDQSR
jgi:hypothetical protein